MITVNKYVKIQMKREGKPNKPERTQVMRYKFKGSLEVRLPEDKEFFGEGDSKEEAVLNMLSRLMFDEETLGEYINLDYLKAVVFKQVFKVTVREVFEHTVEVSTDDYPEITDESEAEYYVENNIEDFEDDFEHNAWTREELSTDCYFGDTEVEEIEV